MVPRYATGVQTKSPFREAKSVSQKKGETQFR
jgi:hypothetical protein